MRRATLTALATCALATSALALMALPAAPAAAQTDLSTPSQEFATYPAPKSRHAVKVVPMVDGLDHPWGLAFLPDGRILVTERTGKLRVVKDGKLLPEPVAGLPPIEEVGQGGLLDVALHPNYRENRLVYLSYAEKDPEREGHRTAIARFTDSGTGLTGMQVIFRGDTVKSRHHFGNRLVFAPDGKLHFSIGDRGQQDNAQNPGSLSGKTFRINDDGSVPADNPFIGKDGYRPELFTLGNRNPQGMALQPGTGALWATEHGPQGGDELNLIQPGVNYGWPTITYGRTYGLGLPIGEGTAKEGLAQPRLHFVPSLALAGLTFYEGTNLPFWRGDAVIALLAGGIARIDIEGDRVVAAERLLEDDLPRTRAVAVSPDGKLYALIDAEAPEGRLVRIERK